MKIALLTGTFSSYSGIDRVVARQADMLRAEGHDITVVCFSGDIQGDGYRVIKIGMPGSLFWQRVYRLGFFCLDRTKIRYAMQEMGKQDTVYSHQYPMNCLAREMQEQWSTRYVYYNHGIPPAKTFQSFLERCYITVFRWMTNRSLRFPDEIISISQYLAKVCKKETGRISRVVHNTTDPKRFRGTIADPKHGAMLIRQNLDIGKNPVLLTVGRLSPHKGLHLLLSAFEKVRQSVPEARLIIVGKATFQKYFAQLRRKAGPNVHFVDYVSDEDLPLYYAACDVYVSASQWEGFNLPFLEAQELQKPVVAFDLGPHPEVFQGQGSLVPSGDIDAMAEAIVKLILKS